MMFLTEKKDEGTQGREISRSMEFLGAKSEGSMLIPY